MALRLRGRRAAHDAGRPERARHHRRSGAVPFVRLAARRLLRQRHAARRRSRGHRSDGRAVRIRSDLFPGHDQRRRGGAHHAGRVAGEHRRQLRLDRHAAGSRHGPGADVRRIAGHQRHGDAACRRTPAAGRAWRCSRAAPATASIRPARSASRTSRPAATRCRREPAAASSSWRGWISRSAPRTSTGLTLVTGARRDRSPARSSATPASRSTSARSNCRSPRGPRSPDAGRGRRRRRRAGRRRLVLQLRNMTDAVRGSRQRAAGLDAEVGVRQWPGHHRYADGVSGGTNRQRDADRADEEDQRAVRTGHRREGQSGARRDGRGVPSRRKAVDLSSRDSSRRRGPIRTAAIASPALPAPRATWCVALQGLEDGQAGDPEFLATVKDLATKLDLGEGETKAVDVKLSAQK